jgi:hypothetical protein
MERMSPLHGKQLSTNYEQQLQEIILLCIATIHCGIIEFTSSGCSSCGYWPEISIRYKGY